jgi:hypothetical protein
MTAHGWAVVQDGEIMLSTVYGSRRGAMVNWLITNGWMILKHTSDDEIEAAWTMATAIEGKDVYSTPRAVEVTVTEKPSDR